MSDLTNYDLPNFPKEVKKFIKQFIPILKDLEADWAEESGEQPILDENDIYEAAITKAIGNKIFINYINEGDLFLYKDNVEPIEIDKDLKLCLLDLILLNLKYKNIIDSIKDENNEEFFFIKKIK